LWPVSKEAAYARADWQRIEQLYGQLMRVVATGHISDTLAGKLAKAMARTCAAYDGIEEQFIEDLLAVIVAVEGATADRNREFRHFYYDPRYNRFTAYLKTDADDRRRPTPFEAAVETCRRLRDVNRLRAQLVRVPTGCILGGSASYGRFFNTVGDRDNEPSDLDLLLVVGDYADLPRVAEAFARVAGIGPGGVESMRERCAAFPEVCQQLDEGQRCIFSHKLKLWPPEAPDPFLAGTGINGEYDVSVHVFSGEDIDFLILRDLPKLEGEREIIDYRMSRPDRPDRQRSFAETEVMVEREGTERECPHGFLVPSRVCHVADADPESGTRYYPGQFQNLILPEVELRWELESHLLYLPLYAFMVKVRERLERERVERPYEIQSIANSHTRKNQFAPYVGERLDDPS
jgi:hypothetical protein